MSGEAIKCDFCETPISSEETITNYLANRLVNAEFVPGSETSDVPFYFLRAYCEECDRRELQYPCVGYTELLLEAELDAHRRFRNVKLLDSSSQDDGIPYNPVEVWEAVHRKASWEEFHQSLLRLEGEPIHLGPADIIDSLLYNDIPPLDVFDKTGAIHASPEELEDYASRISL